MGWDREKERRAGKAMTIGTCVFALVFSIFWCIMAVSMGAWFMLIFGIPFVGMVGHRLYVISQMAKEGPKQEPRKEVDPWELPAAGQVRFAGEKSEENGYCPYCGSSVQAEFEFCPKCGRRLNN